MASKRFREAIEERFTKTKTEKGCALGGSVSRRKCRLPIQFCKFCNLGD